MHTKQTFALIFLAASLCLAGFAQSKQNVVVPPTDLQNIPGDENAWLSSHLQDMIKENLRKYAGFTTLADQNAEQLVMEQQRRSESTAHSETDFIETGKLKNAKYAVFSYARKAGKRYTLSIDFTDLTTGEQQTITSQRDYRTIEELSSKTGAVSEVIFTLCDQLGITLSEKQKAEKAAEEERQKQAQKDEIERQKQEEKSAKHREKESAKKRKKADKDALFRSPRLGFLLSGDLSPSIQNYAFETIWYNHIGYRGVGANLWLKASSDGTASNLTNYYDSDENAWWNGAYWQREYQWDALCGYLLFGFSMPFKRIRPYIEFGGGLGCVNASVNPQFGIYGYVKGGIEARILSHISIDLFCKPQGTWYSTTDSNNYKTNHNVGTISVGIGTSFWLIN